MPERRRSACYSSSSGRFEKSTIRTSIDVPGGGGFSRSQASRASPSSPYGIPRLRENPCKALGSRLEVRFASSMSGRILSPEERARLLATMRRQTPSTVHRRVNAILLLDDGWAAERVAEALFIDAETAREYRKL